MTTEGPTDQPVGELPAVGQTTPAQRLPNADAGHGTTLTVKQAAARLGVHQQTLRRWLWAGKVPGAHLATSGKGEMWQIPVASLEALAAEAKQAAPSQRVVEAGEAEQLRQRVAELEARNQLLQALADERDRTITELSQAVRALGAGQQAAAEQVRTKRWWRRA